MYSPRPATVAELALEDATAWTTASLAPPLRACFNEKFPDLRLAAGALDAAELVARLAQELQLIGDVTPRDTRVHARDASAGTATIVFASMDPHLAGTALFAAAAAVTEVATSPPPPARLAAILDECLGAAHRAGFDQSTQALIRKAEERGIPWFRPVALTRHVQLGQGLKQRTIRETMTSAQSSLGREMCRSKLLTYQRLAPLGLPVGKHAVVRDLDSALAAAANTVGYPLVLKPIEGSKGANVYVHLRNPAELKAALGTALRGGERFLLQSFFPGDDHRLLVVSGKLIAAARKSPASVTGDGMHRIGELVAEANRDPRRGEGYTKLMNRIEIDAEAVRILAQQGYTPGSVPSAGVLVRLRGTANISTGGTAVDVTHLVHPDNARVAVRAAGLLEAEIAGIDFITPDISRSWREVGGGICEVNLLVGLRPHWIANPKADVVGPILETIYSREENARIPAAMITGTKGKTTTSLMLRSILTAAGHTVGCATTEGATVGEEEVLKGDVAGFTGAVPVMRDPMVTAAVLETARGGLIKSGMYLDWCDVAALLNVGREQIGMDGIETLDDMAALKGKVLDAARKAVVLNAEDERCAALAREYRGRIRTFLFSLESGSAAVLEHLESGGEAILLKSIEGRETIVAVGSKVDIIPLVAVSEIPAALDGLIRPNVANAMAASALALGMGVAPSAIRDGLMRYEITVASSRGRFNFVEGFPMKILFDRAATPPSIEAATAVTDAIAPPGKRICATAVPAGRPAWHMEECAAALAGHFDRYICFERDDFHFRGPPGTEPGDTASRLSRALQAAGVAPSAIAVVLTQMEAARAIAQEAVPEDFVAVFASNIKTSVAEYRNAFRDAGKLSGTTGT
jgi:cyanophycin synthetase